MPLNILVAEDDPVSRLFMQHHLASYGQVWLAGDGRHAVELVAQALGQGQPFDLICLDILMPQMDGKEALTAIRGLEEEHGLPLGHGAKVIMTTAMRDVENILGSFGRYCDAYLVKPLDPQALVEQMTKLGLLAP